MAHDIQVFYLDLGCDGICCWIFKAKPGRLDLFKREQAILKKRA